MNQTSKLDYLFDVSIKTLYLAGRLLQESGNFEQVPGWLVDILKVSGSALGIILENQCIVQFFPWLNRSVKPIPWRSPLMCFGAPAKTHLQIGIFPAICSTVR